MQSTMTITTQVKDSLTPSTLLRGASNPSLTLQEQVKSRNISSLVLRFSGGITAPPTYKLKY